MNHRKVFYFKPVLEWQIILRCLFWGFLIFLMSSIILDGEATNAPWIYPLDLLFIAAFAVDLIRIITWNKPQIIIEGHSIIIRKWFGMTPLQIARENFQSVTLRKHRIGKPHIILRYQPDKTCIPRTIVLWYADFNHPDELYDTLLKFTGKDILSGCAEDKSPAVPSPR